MYIYIYIHTYINIINTQQGKGEREQRESGERAERERRERKKETERGTRSILTQRGGSSPPGMPWKGVHGTGHRLMQLQIT